MRAAGRWSPAAPRRRPTFRALRRGGAAPPPAVALCVALCVTLCVMLCTLCSCMPCLPPCSINEFEDALGYFREPQPAPQPQHAAGGGEAGGASAIAAGAMQQAAQRSLKSFSSGRLGSGQAGSWAAAAGNTARAPRLVRLRPATG